VRVVPPPDRNRQVYFVGAGLSSAAGLPNTPSLLDAVLALAKQNRSSVTEDQLLRAFRFFYPDAVHVGFRPGVVDFFSTLRTFLDVGAGFVETGFTDAPDLNRPGFAGDSEPWKRRIHGPGEALVVQAVPA
jgi:hypothetical protein